MGIEVIVSITVGFIAILGSIATVVFTVANRPTYKYCEDTFQRKDLHSQEYHTLLEKIEELRRDIQYLQKSQNKKADESD